MIAFSRAVTGLRIAEQNLYVTSNNLSNVETEGYHRQRLNQYAFQTTSVGNFSVGLGVDASSVRQTRLEFLETNYRNELASYGEYKYEDKVFTSLQSIIGDNGSYLQDTLQDMWESFNQLAKEYTTTIAGGYLRENAVSLVAEFNGINDQLDKMQNELDTEIENVVRKINDYSEQIASLNERITRSEADGSLACELRDSRDSVIAALSELIEIDVENTTDSSVNIRTANGYLVIRNDARKIGTAKIVPMSTFRSPVWADNQEPLELTSGELKGIVDMRGGNVVGNLESSTNGAPKERMEIVVSIDKVMDHATTEGMFKNISNMLNVLDRQDANYKFYLTNGKEISGKDLRDFSQYLYAESAKLQIKNYVDANPGTATMSGLNQYIDGLYGDDSQLSNDLWKYMEANGVDFGLNDFKNYVVGNADPAILEKLEAEFDNFAQNGGATLQDFARYIKSIENNDALTAFNTHMSEYIDLKVPFNEGNLTNYIDTEYAVAVLPDMESQNSENVLENVAKSALIDFTYEDSNKYYMVFTDNKISNDVLRDDTVVKLNEMNMNLIAITNEESKTSWSELVEETGGTVLDISKLETEDGSEELALSISRNFNSRLIGVEPDTGIAYFRSALNSLLNVLAKEINGVLRQGENGYEHRHGEVMEDGNGNIIYDDETGEPKRYNLDLFLKIDDKLPLQMGNIMINPEFDDVMNMPLSLSGDTGDFQIGNMLVDLAATDVFNDKDNYATFDEHYASFILDFGQEANRALTGCEIQETVLATAKDRISQVSGVSMDEELSNMVKFQYTYTAASKMIRVVDEMLESIINM